MNEKHAVLKARLNLVRFLIRNASNGICCTLLADIQANTEKRFLSFSVEKDGYLAYARRPEHKYSTKSRVRTRLGRYLRQFHADKAYSDEEIGYASNLFGFAEKANAEPDLLSGVDITKMYEDCFAYSSCMTGDNAHCVVMYEINPDRVQLAVIRGEFPCRALLWKLDDGRMFLDRTYGTAEPSNAMIQWAKNKGYITWPERQDHNMDVTLENIPKLWPYMDTFKYMQCDGKTVSLSSHNHDYDHVLDRTDGHLRDETTCYSCGEECSEDYTDPDGHYMCESCYCDQYCDCSYCGETVSNDDVRDVSTRNYTEYWCEDCRDRHAFYCEYDDGWRSTRSYDSVEVMMDDGTTQTWEKSNAENNAYYWESDDEWHESEEPATEKEEHEAIISEPA